MLHGSSAAESKDRTFSSLPPGLFETNASSRRGIIAIVVEYAGADRCRKVSAVFHKDGL
jgi:hypothetical protein